MHSTLKLRESDPHDIFAIEPETVPVAWADKVLADIQRDANGAAPDQPPQPAASVATGATPPMVDTTFRAVAADDIHAPDIHIPTDLAADRPPGSKWAKSAVMLVFAVCSAAAAAAWQQHGDAAKQMIASWVPAFALTSSPTPEKAGPAGQAEPAAVQASAADPAPPQPAASAQPPASAAPVAAAASPESAQLQSMSHDLAAMGQQIEQLKASIAELKANQQVAARDVAKPSEVKPSEVKPSIQNPRTRMSALPPRSAAAPSRRPTPAYAPVQAAAPAPLPQPVPQASPYPAAQPPAPPQATVESDGEPVVRPPMPLR
jgi:hypothetical protein